MVKGAPVLPDYGTDQLGLGLNQRRFIDQGRFSIISSSHGSATPTPTKKIFSPPHMTMFLCCNKDTDIQKLNLKVASVHIMTSDIVFNTLKLKHNFSIFQQLHCCFFIQFPGFDSGFSYISCHRL